MPGRAKEDKLRVFFYFSDLKDHLMQHIETERKFLVDHDAWKKLKKPPGQTLYQGYLCADEKKTIRVRVVGEQGFITIKGEPTGCSRREFEYPVPGIEAAEILNLFTKNIIRKTRYRIHYKNLLWEVDEFHDENNGLILAEIELNNENDCFEKPDWIGMEVTTDRRYYNSYLSVHPYSGWINKKP